MAKPEVSELAVVYARYSSHSQGEQSIEGQLSNARDYAAAHGYTIVHEYVDRAKSGRTDNRAEFQQMLKDTAKRQFSVIILWKVDRFGRNREEIAINKMKCRKNGVRVEYVAETIPDSPEGVILESVLEGFAEYYSLQLSQNIRRGRAESAEKCQSLGGNRPLGYKTGPDKKFVIDENTAPTVKMIFTMYADGKTVTEIVDKLNEMGLRTLRGGPFTKNSLHSILKNKKYIGVYEYQGREIKDGVPRIIEDDVFNKVQEMLKINKRAPAKTWSRADYILTDKLFCGKCGALMFGESGTSATGRTCYYYKCADVKRRKGCNKRPGQGRTLCPSLSARCGGRQPSILCSTKSPTILSSWLTACSAPLAILRAVRRIWRWLVLVAMTPAAPSAAPAAMPIRSGAVELVCSFFIGGTPFESKFLGCEDSISAKGFTIRFFCAGKCGILYDMLINWAGYGLAWFMGKSIFCEGGFFFAEDNGTEKSSLHP